MPTSPSNRRRLAPALLAGALLLAAPPALAQRVSLESIDVKIDGIQATLDQGPTPISACGTIDQPGSYVLVNNLTSNPAGSCLFVGADHVTLDLGGFRVECGGSGIGVRDLSTRTATTVRNGTISGCGGGVRFTSSDSAVVEHLRVVGNTGTGIWVGKNATVAGNAVNSNGGNGILAGGGSRVTGNIADENGSFGILGDAGSTVSGNTARKNGTFGILGGIGATVSGNTAQGNGDDGINADLGSTVTGNTAHSNGGHGIRVLCPSNVIGNTATLNATTIATGQNLELVGTAGTCNLSNNLAP